MRKHHVKRPIPACPRRKFLRFLSLLTALLCLPGLPVSRAVSWRTFSPDAVPDDLGFLINEYTGTVRITFLGDCTLGGMQGSATSSHGYLKTVRREGMAWPMHGLISLTGSDDLTVANLEGVLTDRSLPKTEKRFNFSGPTELTGVLTEGSVECVTLANNHSGDFGTAGYQDTKAALEQAGVAWFGTDAAAVWERDGLMIGFVGVSFSLSGKAGERFRSQMASLRSLGCAAVIVFMHAGREYDPAPSSAQRKLAAAAVEAGADLVIGSHPHIVQGYEIIAGKPVLYSLGNCSFGGNSDPRDYTALVARTDLAFSDGELTGIKLRFFPISVSGNESRNDYAPVLLDGERADEVLRRMAESTGYDPGVFTEDEGAVTEVLFSGKTVP